MLARQAAQTAAVAARQKAQQQAAAQAALDAAKTQQATTISTETAQALANTSQKIQIVTTRIDTLHTRETALQQQIAEESASFRLLVPIALQVRRSPEATLLATGDTQGQHTQGQAAGQAVRGLTILSGISTLVEHNAERLHDQHAELAATGADLTSQSADLAALQATQAEQNRRAGLATRQAIRTEKRADAAVLQARRAVAEAARQATALQAAIAQIEQAEHQAQTRLDAEAEALTRAHQAAKAQEARNKAHALAAPAGPGPTGHGGAPVSGPTLTSYGQETESGPATGITYNPPALSAVHAPCAGRIEFSGPFRSFGQMLILDCGRDYRFVLAGLGTLSVGNGSSIPKGGTLGTMPSDRSILFVQLRHGSQSVNPAPFL